MKRSTTVIVLGMSLVLGALPRPGSAQGDPARGGEAFRNCAACHSLEPGRHMTGPSLAGVVGRKAGASGGFSRYTGALADSGLVWDRATLDRWLAGPQSLVPETSMRVRGIADADTRADLIAFLAAGAQAAGEGGGMTGGMMGGRSGRMPDLGTPTPRQRVVALRHCGDTYHVTLGTGRTYAFWEFNLRFKTDSSDVGPKPGAPAIVGQGMRGDRAQVVFATPREISAFIESRCAQ